jgi:hypothetical protein
MLGAYLTDLQGVALRFERHQWMEATVTTLKGVFGRW